MALFINGVGQDTFNMNGVSIDNLYVDGVLVWSSAVNTKPVITIIGDNPMYLVLDGSAYVEQGATATDAEDGDISNDIVIGGDTPDVSVEGYYYVTYNVTDSEGLAADERLRTVQVYVVTVPKYEMTEELINDGTFDYVPDSNNPESSFIGKLTESDGTTPYEPTALQYPQNGLLELDNGRIMDTQFTVDPIADTYGLYGIYDADGSTAYKIWALEMIEISDPKLYEGDQDTPLTLTGTIAFNPDVGTWKITDGRPSWMPALELLDNPNFDVNIDGVVDEAGATSTWQSPGWWRTTNNGADTNTRNSAYPFTVEIGVEYIADCEWIGGSEPDGVYVAIRKNSDASSVGTLVLESVYGGPITFTATETEYYFGVLMSSAINSTADIDSISLKKA